MVLLIIDKKYQLNQKNLHAFFVSQKNSGLFYRCKEMDFSLTKILDPENVLASPASRWQNNYVSGAWVHNVICYIQA